jgi:hypothetical protein
MFDSVIIGATVRVLDVADLPSKLKFCVLEPKHVASESLADYARMRFLEVIGKAAFTTKRIPWAMKRARTSRTSSCGGYTMPNLPNDDRSSIRMHGGLPHPAAATAAVSSGKALRIVFAVAWMRFSDSRRVSALPS